MPLILRKRGGASGHIDHRFIAFERVLFGCAAPEHVILTTPNQIGDQDETLGAYPAESLATVARQAP